MINIALIGYGYWGPNVARNIFESKLTKLHSVCDKRPERLNMAKTRYLNQTSYTLDYKDFLINDEIDAIAIVIETSAHFNIAREAIMAGKHVFIASMIQAGDTLSFMGVPPGSGQRMGIDRNLDGILDGDGPPRVPQGRLARKR